MLASFLVLGQLVPRQWGARQPKNVLMDQPRPLSVFSSFQTIYRIKTVEFSGIRTRIDEV